MKRYTYYRPSSTLIVDGKEYRHGDDITELGPEWFDRLGDKCRCVTEPQQSDASVEEE
jgi:hypothetical protein